MRDYRHSLMGQEHKSKLAADRSTPQRAQLWRHKRGTLYEIVALAKSASDGDEIVVYRQYEPNGETFWRPLTQFMSPVEGGFRFTREY